MMARAPVASLLLLVLAATQAHASSSPPPGSGVCSGPIVRLDVYAPDGADSPAAAAAGTAPFSVEYAVPAAFGGLPPAASAPRARLRLRLADPVTACGAPAGGNGAASSAPADTAAAAAAAATPSPDFAGALVLAARGGNCSFAAKYDYLVRQLGAAGMLVYDDRPGCIVMGAAPPPPPAPSPDHGADPAPAPPPPPAADADDDAQPALSLDHDRGLALAELVRAVEGSGGGAVEVEAWMPDLSRVPGAAAAAYGAMAALALLATGTVVAGAAWSGRDHRRALLGYMEDEEEEEEEEGDAGSAQGGGGGGGGGARRPRGGRRRRQERRRARAGAAAGATAAAEGDHPLDITPAGAAWFVVVASASLLVIWMLRGPAVAVFITGAFALGGAQGVCAWLAPALLLLALPGGGGGGRGGGGLMGARVRVPDWLAGVLSGLMGLSPLDDDDDDDGEQGGGGAREWQALPPQPPPPTTTTTTATTTTTSFRRADLLAASLSLLCAALWLCADALAWPGAWVGQDLLACSLLVQLLRMLRLPSLKAACVLLPLVLLYDVFWVFLQPRLFGGDSVMVDVATGAGGGGGGWAARPLPLLLRVPSPLFGRRLFSSALPGLPASIAVGGDSLLGFGDVVLPGMLAALARRTDVERELAEGEAQEQQEEEDEEAAAALAGGSSSAATAVVAPLFRPLACAAAWGARRRLRYLPAVALAYAVGLAITYAALQAGVGGEGGQPALLYLSPSVLLAFGAVAWARGELAQCWEAGGGSDGGGRKEEEEDGG